MLFALDVYSGAVHVVDQLMYDILERINNGEAIETMVLALQSTYSMNDINQAVEELNTLKDKGQLFAEDTYQPIVDSFADRETVVKAMCLHIAHDCNLACKYCFASEGEYHGDRSMMSLEVGKKSIDYLVTHSGNRTNLEIDFFGGEPLMNFEVVKGIVTYAKSIEESYGKHFRFTLTTNGVLLTDDIIAYLNEHMYNVVLSIDGRKEVHDKMRPTPNGKGSYDLILPKLKQVASSRNQKNYYVRGTFTHFNTDFAEDVMHLADQGFKQISVEPVVAEKRMSYALTDDDVEVLKKQYDILAEKMLEYKEAGKPFNFFHFMIDLGQGPCVIKRLTGCGAGTEYMAITPWGDFYPCHQFVGDENFLLGNVDAGVTNLELQKDFKNCHVYNKEDCTDCWAKFYCSGGCAANAQHFHGNIHKTYECACELEKKRVEMAIYLKATEIIE
jgi:uncharacterized protein